jgi:hypothetical protein
MDMSQTRLIVASAAEPLNGIASVDAAAAGFTGAGGTVLDPSSPANGLAFGQNIRLSIATSEDDDTNGIEDRR